MIGTETNYAVLQGIIIHELEFSHKTYGEAFYETKISVERKSGYCDEIRVLLSDRLIPEKEIFIGDCVRIEGQVRTYNEEEDGKTATFPFLNRLFSGDNTRNRRRKKSRTFDTDSLQLRRL